MMRDRNGKPVKAGAKVRFRASYPFQGYWPVFEGEGTIQAVYPSWVEIKGPEHEESGQTVNREQFRTKTTTYMVNANFDHAKQELRLYDRREFVCGPTVHVRELWVELI